MKKEGVFTLPILANLGLPQHCFPLLGVHFLLFIEIFKFLKKGKQEIWHKALKPSHKGTAKKAKQFLRV